MPHGSSYSCTNCTWKDNISELSFLLPFESTWELKQWIRWNWQSQTQCGCQTTGLDWPRIKSVDWPNHENDNQQPPTFSHILHTLHIYFITNKIHLRSSNEVNSQNKCSHLDGNFFSGSAITVKSLYKLALHKMRFDGAFLRKNIYKLYLLLSHARNSLITYK